jgi:hypothetical protein
MYLQEIAFHTGTSASSVGGEVDMVRCQDKQERHPRIDVTHIEHQNE